ncbi:MAG TPA: ABC transporter permease [Bacteroidia bacterium]|nr:ABC transporter permease [Bacteroidia bacterium]
MQTGSLKNSTEIWYVLKKRRLVKFSMGFMLVLLFIAIIAPLLSNDKPLYLSYKGEYFFPAFSGIAFADIKTKNPERIYFEDGQFRNLENVSYVMPLIPYSPHKSDLDNSDYKSPGETQIRLEKNGQESELKGLNRHLLGTGKRGEDLLSGLIHGSRVSLMVGICAMTIAGIIGIILGALAGYFGDHELKIRRANIWMLLIGILPSWFYGFQLRSFDLSDALKFSTGLFVWELLISILLFIVILTLFYLSGSIFSKVPFLNKRIHFPMDSVISRVIEIITSLPRLILILSLAAIARPSLFNLVLIIGLTSWTEIARFTRAEMLRIRNMDFIQSARSMGFTDLRIILVHALPNAIAPALVAIAFGIASAILVESGLSFLGIGVPQNIVTWGSLLAAGKENFSAWWLVVFPGIAIFMTVTIYNLLGEALRDAMDPKLRK